MVKIRTFKQGFRVWLIGSVAAFFVSVTVGAESDEDFLTSQTLRGEAITLFRAGRLPEAAEKLEAALALRPDNAALLFNLSFLAVQMEDTGRAARYAGQYAVLGLALPQNIQDDLKALLPAEIWLPIAEGFSKAQKPVGEGRVLLTVPAEHRLVEGITADGSGNWFLSTVADGKILKTSGDGKYTVLAQAADHEFGSFFGIQYHSDEQALYATYGHVDQSRTVAPKSRSGTGLVKFDAGTGDVLGNWELVASEGAQQIADITITSMGTVFISDAQANKLYQLDEEGLKPLNLDAAFMSLQGIAEATDGTLLVADYGRGVWRLDANLEAIRLLNAPAGQTLLGIDGLFRANGRIYAVQNGVTPHRIIELQVSESMTDITDVRTVARNLPEFDEPTLGMGAGGGFAVVASSQWPKFGEKGVVKAGASYDPTVVLEISTD